MIVKIGAAKYDIESGDAYIHEGQDFEPDIVQLFRELVRPGAVVYDVGANVGCTALALSQFAEIVHAFEPSPLTYGFLRENILRSGVHNVQAHNIGLGDFEKFATLTYSAHDRSGAFVSDLSRADKAHKTEDIKIYTIDGLVEAGLAPPEFIKIDVEGYELSVLDGAAKTLREFHPVVLLEMNHWTLNVFQRIALPDFIEELLNIFPTVYAVHGAARVDLHDPENMYPVMRHHVLEGMYNNLICGWND